MISSVYLIMHYIYALKHTIGELKVVTTKYVKQNKSPVRSQLLYVIQDFIYTALY